MRAAFLVCLIVFVPLFLAAYWTRRRLSGAERDQYAGLQSDLVKSNRRAIVCFQVILAAGWILIFFFLRARGIEKTTLLLLSSFALVACLSGAVPLAGIWAARRRAGLSSGVKRMFYLQQIILLLGLLLAPLLFASFIIR